MLDRISKWEDVVGQERIIKHFKAALAQGTVKQNYLFIGPEGVGKTTIAKLVAMSLNCDSHLKPCYECPACKRAMEVLIKKNENTEEVSIFKMSENGGKDAALQIIAAMNTNFLPAGKKKVIIADECDGMSEDACKALHQALEFIPKDVYLIFLVNDPTRLNKVFASRFIHLTFKPLTTNQMLSLLRKEVASRGIDLLGGDAALRMIAAYSENKPRTALSILERYVRGEQVSLEDIKDATGFVDMSEVIPIISSLNTGGSMMIGIDTILNLTINLETQLQLVQILAETVKIVQHQKSFRFGVEDTNLIREAVNMEEPENYIKFLSYVAQLQTFNKVTLVGAYLKAHPLANSFYKHSADIIGKEVAYMQQLDVEQDLVEEAPTGHDLCIPTIDELLSNAKILRD